ncbi:MAG TPA: hypothetical protein VF767_06625 [Bryobacteraceae bacterium]
MKTGPMPGDHTTEDQLEDYCLGRIPASELEGTEEHLLVCPDCQEHLRETDRYIRTMRAAIGVLASAPPRPARPWSQWFEWMGKPAPATALAGLAAIALVWGVLPALRERREAAPAVLTLEAMRGESSTLYVSAPERTPLLLKLDLTGVAPLESYRVFIVDAQGAPVFETQARPDSGNLAVRAPARLVRGAYWVRLYDRAAPGVPLREYGLELR